MQDFWTINSIKCPLYDVLWFFYFPLEPLQFRVAGVPVPNTYKLNHLELFPPHPPSWKMWMSEFCVSKCKAQRLRGTARCVSGWAAHLLTFGADKKTLQLTFLLVLTSFSFRHLSFSPCGRTGTIKLPILRGSNNANTGWFWEISPE